MGKCNPTIQQIENKEFSVVVNLGEKDSTPISAQFCPLEVFTNDENKNLIKVIVDSSISSEDKKEFLITMKSEIIVQCESVPEDVNDKDFLNEIMKSIIEKIVPMIDNALEALGHNKITSTDNQEQKVSE